jgi:hypothetical protein
MREGSSRFVLGIEIEQFHRNLMQIQPFCQSRHDTGLSDTAFAAHRQNDLFCTAVGTPLVGSTPGLVELFMDSTSLWMGHVLSSSAFCVFRRSALFIATVNRSTPGFRLDASRRGRVTGARVSEIRPAVPGAIESFD